MKKMHLSPLTRLGLELFLASFLALYLELVLIRWLPAKVRVLAYFPNLILLGAFLGLGIGCLRAGRRSLLWLWPVGLLVLVGASLVGSQIAFTQDSVTEHLWLLYMDLPATARVFGDVRLPIVVAFVLTAMTFVPVGQIVAERLQAFGERGQSLQGYCWDIGGSLFGVIGFALLGFWGLFPVVWFMPFFLLAGLFFWSRKGLLALHVIAAVTICLAVHLSEKATLYSPYYAISYSQSTEGSGVSILTNGSLHQVAVDLSRDDQGKHPVDQRIRQGYEIPYRWLVHAPEKVLILGAGSGNDVAVAIHAGVKEIHAVEIDPVILDLGKSVHPNRPYSSDRAVVKTFAEDARSFLNHTTDTYDLIVFGTLDSMTRLSALSNVRLDNFVYTRECVEQARKKLKPNGGMVMYFMVATPFIHQRIESLLAQAFHEKPKVIRGDYRLFNTLFMAGPAFSSHSEVASTAAEAIPTGRTLPSDDWPYLYLAEKGISGFYLFLMGSFVLLSLIFIMAASSDMKISLLKGNGVDVQMFLFGLAFLLLETRYVTQMNLVWGATWITSAVVFGSILFTILLSTLFARIHQISLKVSGVLLILSLIGTYALPAGFLVHQSGVTKLLLSLIWVGIPIFFAATCFAVLFKSRPRADLAFGWNLLGAVTGGLAEFCAMLIGFRMLLLVATLVYVVALLLPDSARVRATSQAKA